MTVVDLENARKAAHAGGIVVIGAGQAGGRAVEALRTHGYAGAITLIGDEGEYPYERPSLSKEMLLDSETETIAWVQKPDFYAAQNIEFISDDKATVIDRQARMVKLASGRTVDYGVAIIATGAKVRKLSVTGVTASNCFYLRNLADSRTLRSRFSPGHRVVVIGAGFIGLEVAAAAVQRGCDVSVIELGVRPLGRVVPDLMGEYYRELHESRGVTFFFGTSINALDQHDGLLAVELSNGRQVAADTVIAGIGVIPNTELAAAAGLQIDRGIVVDEFARTNDPFIFAVGDVSRHYSPVLAKHVLLESWQIAQNQSIALAKNLASSTAPLPYAELPWFWSDQYEVNLQMFGVADAGANTIVRGDRTQKSWMLLQLQNGKITCAIGINAARELRVARDLMTLGARVTQDELQSNSPLIEILRREKAKLALVN